MFKDERKIPLTPVQQPNSISDLEEEAARFSQIFRFKIRKFIIFYCFLYPHNFIIKYAGIV